MWFFSTKPNQRAALLYLTPNRSENGGSYFLAHGFLVMHNTDNDIIMFLVRSSGVDTASASMVDFYCWWLLQLPEDLYNLLIFSKHLCLWRSLSVKDWYNPIVTISCLSFSHCNNTFSMTHLCPKYPILIIVSKL